jgi:hypothetical protein
MHVCRRTMWVRRSSLRTSCRGFERQRRWMLTHDCAVRGRIVIFPCRIRLDRCAVHHLLQAVCVCNEAVCVWDAMASPGAAESPLGTARYRFELAPGALSRNSVRWTAIERCFDGVGAPSCEGLVRSRCIDPISSLPGISFAFARPNCSGSDGGFAKGNSRLRAIGCRCAPRGTGLRDGRSRLRSPGLVSTSSGSSFALDGRL